MSIKKQDIIKEVLWWVKTIAFLFIFTLILNKKVSIFANIESGSMEETIMTYDQVYGNRLSYEFSDPERGDIVFFYAPDEPQKIYIKRLIGIPGDHIVIKDSKIYFNDSIEPITESYLKEEWVIGNDGYEYTVPENSYFMLGDNRNDSFDSRYWKNTFVSREMIIGKAEFIYFPFWNIKILK